MLSRTAQMTVALICLLFAGLLAGCATDPSKMAYRNRISCPPSFMLYCKTRDYGSQGSTRQCRCVRQDSFDSMP